MSLTTDLADSASSVVASGRNLADVSFSIGERPVDRLEDLRLGRRPVDEFSLPEAALRGDEFAVEEHIELAELPLLDDYIGTEAAAQLDGQFLRAVAVATGPAVQDVKLHGPASR